MKGIGRKFYAIIESKAEFGFIGKLTMVETPLEEIFEIAVHSYGQAMEELHFISRQKPIKV